MSYVVDTQFRNLCDMAKAVHKGELVRKRITQSGVSVKSIAARLGVSRQTLYDYLERDDLNFDIINRIGFAIKYDFSKLLRHGAASAKNFPSMRRATRSDICLFAGVATCLR